MMPLKLLERTIDGFPLSPTTNGTSDPLRNRTSSIFPESGSLPTDAAGQGFAFRTQEEITPLMFLNDVGISPTSAASSNTYPGRTFRSCTDLLTILDLVKLSVGISTGRIVTQFPNRDFRLDILFTFFSLPLMARTTYHFRAISLPAALSAAFAWSRSWHFAELSGDLIEQVHDPCEAKVHQEDDQADNGCLRIHHPR